MTTKPPSPALFASLGDVLRKAYRLDEVLPVMALNDALKAVRLGRGRNQSIALAKGN